MILPKSPPAVVCSGCSADAHMAQSHQECDVHSPCPGYGTTDSCPPLIVLAVHEWMTVMPAVEVGRRSV